MSRKESNIRKRKDGRWEARYIRGKDEHGKSVYASVYGKTYTEAKEKRKLCLMNLQQLEQSDYDKLYKSWLNMIYHKVKESTYARYKYVGDHYIFDYFSRYQTQNITTKTIENFIYNHMKDYSSATIKLSYTVLKMILNYGITIGYIKQFQFDHIGFKKNTHKPRYLTKEEQSIIEKHLDINHNLIHLGIYLALYTGIRLGELCALKWSDISLSDHSLHITRTIQRISDTTQEKNKTKIIITEPKSLSSYRIIPIPLSCYEKLIKHATNNEAYLLTNNDKYIEPRMMEYHFSKLVKECQLDGVHFHTLRHTFTTRCIEAGFELKVLSEILGHSSVSFTLDRYGHTSFEAKKQYMNRL